MKRFLSNTIFAFALVIGANSFATHAGIQKRLITPTMVFLENPDLKQRVRQLWGKEISLYSDSVIKPVLINEVRFNDTHYCFYHAQQPLFQLIHDLCRELYSRLGKGAVPNDFTFFRFWQDGVEQATAQEFIDAYEDSDHAKRWYNREVTDKILSVNVALFGNLHRDGECSFSYFLRNYSVNQNFHDKGLHEAQAIAHHLVEDILKKLSLNTAYAKPLSELTALLESKTGNLFQIMIPKGKVDDWVYICHGSSTNGFGTPYRVNDLSNDPRVLASYDPEKNRYVKISPLLDAYRKNPRSLLNINKIQARIVFVPELFDPYCGMKVIKYSTISSDALAQYHMKLKELVGRILTESRKSFN